ncbi:iron-siderophore ABC transporter substrate-binding protein [Nocardiopsis sp. CNT-189]|uniref:iron-siderophore ABC transporter substrate-binding protein n=1 Tax=Nocardiopsis oceanisediminis TaxID=2816862 RepID=UPI003B335C8B
MPLPRTAAALAAGAAALTALAGCGSGAAGPQGVEGETRTVSGAGGEVEVPADPQRVVVLWRPTLAAAVRLGAEVAGTAGDPGGDGGLAPFLPPGEDGAGLEIVSTSSAEDGIDLEKVGAVRPDLIIGVDTENGAQAGMLPELEAIAPTVLLEWTGTESWRGHLAEVGEVLGRQDEAERAEREYTDAVAEARARIEEAAGDPAEQEVSLLRLQSAQEVRIETPDSFSGGIAADIGLARPEGHAEADAGRDFISESYENLERADAGVLFVMSGSGYPEAPETFGGGVWSELDAVRDGQVYAVDYDVWGASNHYAALRVADEMAAALAGEADPAL